MAATSSWIGARGRTSGGSFPYPLNRRREERIGFVAPLRVESHRDVEARSANLSAYGMRIRSTRPLPEGAVIDVRFELPSGQELRVSAVVVDSRGAAASLHFPALSRADRARLRRFVVERRMRSAGVRRRTHPTPR